MPDYPDILDQWRPAPSASTDMPQGPVQSGRPISAPTPMPPRDLPGPGYIKGTLYLDPKIAPKVPTGEARPFAPGEYIVNAAPHHGWSSEETMTIDGNKSLNNGKPTVVPSLWIKDGKPYVAKNEDEAAELAEKSGLTFPSFETLSAADKFANEREDNWEKIGEPSTWKKTNPARNIAPLWNSANEVESSQ